MKAYFWPETRLAWLRAIAAGYLVSACNLNGQPEEPRPDSAGSEASTPATPVPTASPSLPGDGVVIPTDSATADPTSPPGAGGAPAIPGAAAAGAGGTPDQDAGIAPRLDAGAEAAAAEPPYSPAP